VLLGCLRTGVPRSIELQFAKSAIPILLVGSTAPTMSRVKHLEWPSRMPEEEWEEVSQGIPGKEEPFIQKYYDGQAQLIEQEKKQRSGMPSLPLPIYQALPNKTQTTASAPPSPPSHAKPVPSSTASACTNRRPFGPPASKTSCPARREKTYTRA